MFVCPTVSEFCSYGCCHPCLVITYIKYFAKKITGDENAENQLNEDNAEDIYHALSQMKGTALKAAQIISMDKSFLPQAYQDKFAQAQYSVPPLSFPLVVKTFQQNFQKKITLQKSRNLILLI